MKCYRLFLAVSLVCPLFWGETLTIIGGSPEKDPAVVSVEPTVADSVIISLPGTPPKAAAVKPPAVVPDSPASAERPKVVLPSEFQQESAMYLQRLIGTWALADARALLGEPLRQRPSYEEDKSVVGQIYAFPDPSKRYKEMELDFDADSGLLHGVFVYPQGLTWQECRRLWSGEVSPTEGPNGRTFYSYTNRHLDVLVDRAGKVISLGLY
jgi:hypothetical protein